MVGDDSALLKGVVAGVVLLLLPLLLASSSSDDSDESELITFGLDALLGLGIEVGAAPEEAGGGVVEVGSEEGVGVGLLGEEGWAAPRPSRD